MGWKTTTEMNEKIAFINELVTGEFSMTELCGKYGISRKTGYALRNRWQEDPVTFHLARSKRPHTSPGCTDEEVIARIRYWRQGGDSLQQKKWGARKIWAKLLGDFSASRVPCETTIHKILRRQGLIVPRKKRPRPLEPSRPRFETDHSNEIWSADYKGYRLLGNGRKCYPLTICDNYSRHIMKIAAAYRESQQDVITAFRALFREYGQPEHVLTDNGSVFSSAQSPCGYGRFSYFLIEHGIRHLLSDPGCPTQNGKHERMHRELERECFSPAAIDLRVQSQRFGQFRSDYNTVRPHEGLDLRTPSSVYERSGTVYEERVRPYDYPSEMKVRKVYATGCIRWGSYEWVTITRALAGRYIAHKTIGERCHEFYYREVCLGFFREGEEVIKENYYRLISSRDMPEKYRDWEARKRK
ncbi:transposase InsO family protein [Lewinella aquimaris]|uniref:Transposase InsO family protein n=1 Tax=Neolewinella aquimaris TaxID=1835722 RepID=A0A840E569_9BACT|nr:DDE-type integrase/transposase/recombinase [Neolewinella aquimaris]MBB4080784.1 transposase InsO family protein [Neolewinella aquimaris]